MGFQVPMDKPKMGEIKTSRRKGTHAGDRIEPRFDVQLWGNKGRYRRTAIEMHPGYITAEEMIVPLINVVMGCVTRGGDRADFELADPDRRRIVRWPHLLFCDRTHLTPKATHFRTENSSGGFHQARWIHEVIGADRMNVNRRPGLGQVPGRAGMIEMNVAQKNVPHVLRRKTRDPHFEGESLEGGIGSGIEEYDSLLRLERDRGNDSGTAEMPGIENVNHREAEIVANFKRKSGILPRLAAGILRAVKGATGWKPVGRVSQDG